MARKGKWLTSVTPELPASEAARQALESRLYLVWRFLPLAAQRSDEDLEYVHQLRVATRRALAAVACFEPFCPPKRAARLRRHLKQIRKAAGGARDADVLLARLRERARQANSAWEEVLGRVEQQRRTAQRPIEKIHRRLERQQFGKRIEKLLRKVRHRPPEETAAERGHGHPNGHATAASEPSFGEFARQGLRQAVDRLYGAAGADLRQIDALHQMRIEGKNLRYAIELLAEAFDPRLRVELYPVVERLQERLGEVNDHAVGIETITQLQRLGPAEAAELLETLIGAEQAALAQCRGAFAEWWTPSRAGELRHRFAEVLGDIEPEVETLIDESEPVEQPATSGAAS